MTFLWWLFVICFARPASAEEEPIFSRTVISFSPTYLLYRIVEGTIEQRVARRWSTALIAATGKPVELSENQLFYQLGGQGRYYFSGNFDGGFQLGLEFLYSSLSQDVHDDVVAGRLWKTGPFVGMKITDVSRFVLDLQLGYSLHRQTTTAEPSGIETVDLSHGILFNCKIGIAL